MHADVLLPQHTPQVIGIEALQSLNEIEAAVQAKYAEAGLRSMQVEPLHPCGRFLVSRWSNAWSSHQPSMDLNLFGSPCNIYFEASCDLSVPAPRLLGQPWLARQADYPPVSPAGGGP